MPEAQILPKEFYTRATLSVARDLLGKYIVRQDGGYKLEGKIIETEAYIGPHDRAAHSYGGKVTPRNKIKYSEGGVVYIYLVYGLHWQLNIVTGQKDKPECVLIRALDRGKLANGPGKVCRFLKLDKSFYGEDLTSGERVWLEDRGARIKRTQILATPRVGIDYAGPYWSQRKWRFVHCHLRGGSAVS